MPDVPTLSFQSDPEGRAHEAQRLRECSAEPIRTLGKIQSHGTLLGVDAATRQIVVASDNAAEWLGRTIDEAGSDVLAWAIVNAAAVDPVRAEFEGELYDVIVHRGTDPLLVELEPVAAQLEYARTGVVGAIQRLASMTDIDELRVRAAEEIKQITGYDRVMVYHFHKDGHGQVVADAREPEMDSYFGLHFPASDIPSQARALYIEKQSRVIADTEDHGLGLQSILGDDYAVDLGLTELRASSPHHLVFMRNMGQAATVSFALVVNDTLIGMITCAHRSPRRIPVLLRRAIEVMASQLSTQIMAATEIQSLRRELGARERRAALTAPLHGRDDVAAILLGSARSVLDIVPADGVVLRLGDNVHSLGVVPPMSALAPVLETLAPGPFVSEALALERPELAVELVGVTGLLIVPLTDDGDCLVFLRGEVSRTVEWLGDQSPANRDNPLSPRRSFTAWRESVTGRSLPWGDYADDAWQLGESIRAAMAARAQAHLAELALRDALTGLHNRRFLDERLADVLSRTRHSVSVIFIDLDYFKRINDAHGHEVGDAVLATVGRRLSGNARGDDIVARLGGDEFIMVCIDARDAEAIAGRVIDSLAQPIDAEGVELSVSASAGVVTITGDAEASDVISAADAAMYRAKRAGRGRVSA